jgi:glucokinase
VSAPRQPIGIDVGGTKIAAAAVDPASGEVSYRQEIPTGMERGAAAVSARIETLAAAIGREMSDAGCSPEAIGIGLPELVDAAGTVRSAHLGDWSAVSLSARLGRIAPTVITSDVRAAALAEARYGAGRDHRLFVYISIGTGISSAIVQDGEPLVGARGGALVLSSGPVSVPCAACGGWSEFVLEEYASGAALARRQAEATGAAVASAEAVISAANAGEPTAAAIVDGAARALGSAIGWLVNVVDPEAVVLGGGLGLAPGRFHDRLIAAIRAHVWNPEARDLPVTRAALGRDAGVVGATLAAARALNPAQFWRSPHPPAPLSPCAGRGGVTSWNAANSDGHLGAERSFAASPSSRARGRVPSGWRLG